MSTVDGEKTTSGYSGIRNEEYGGVTSTWDMSY